MNALSFVLESIKVEPKQCKMSINGWDHVGSNQEQLGLNKMKI